MAHESVSIGQLYSDHWKELTMCLWNCSHSWCARKLHNFYASEIEVASSGLSVTVLDPYLKLSKMKFSDQCLCLAIPADNQLQICARAVQTHLCWSFQLFLDHRPGWSQIQRPNAKSVQSCIATELFLEKAMADQWSWCCNYHAMVPSSKGLEIYAIWGMELLFTVIPLISSKTFPTTINTLFPLPRPGSWFGQSFKPSTSNSCLDVWGPSTSVSAVSSGSPS